MKHNEIFTELLLILFIGLKLTGYINWPWWWVLSPAWIPLTLCLLALLIFVIFYFIYKD